MFNSSKKYPDPTAVFLEPANEYYMLLRWDAGQWRVEVLHDAIPVLAEERILCSEVYKGAGSHRERLFIYLDGIKKDDVRLVPILNKIDTQFRKWYRWADE